MLTVTGRTTERPDEPASLAFAFAPASAPPAVPELLEDLTVEQLEPDRFRLRSGLREWTFTAVACHLHYDVSTSFYRALPPRTPPWHKRLFWRLVLALAAHPLGKRLLALRRH